MRPLILADDCNPEWPSLPVVGFKTARALANHCDAKAKKFTDVYRWVSDEASERPDFFS